MEEQNQTVGARPATKYRNSIRITFHVTESKIEILSLQYLNMICPPTFGRPPQEGKNCGYWLEARDKNEQVLFYRLLDSPLGDSVAVHLSKGKIERKYSEAVNNTFEVLIPDIPEITHVVFIGESLEPMGFRVKNKVAQEASKELARFDMSKEQKGEQR